MFRFVVCWLVSSILGSSVSEMTANCAAGVHQTTCTAARSAFAARTPVTPAKIQAAVAPPRAMANGAALRCSPANSALPGHVAPKARCA